MKNKILNLLYKNENPYNNFKRREKIDLEDNFYWRHIREIIFWSQPLLVLEVGTGSGNSSVETSKHIRNRKFPNDSIIIVNDTFLNKDGKLDFSKRYEEFLSYILANRLQDLIFPYASTSLDAARLFHENKVEFDLINISGKEAEPEIAQNIRAHYQNLRDCGIMYGDNYIEGNHICQAVRKFSSESGAQIIEDFESRKWMLGKNCSFRQRETE